MSGARAGSVRAATQVDLASTTKIEPASSGCSLHRLISVPMVSALSLPGFNSRHACRPARRKSAPEQPSLMK